MELEYTDMYAEMDVGKHIIMTSLWKGEMGQMYVTLYSGDTGKIILGHEDNKDLEPAHRLWLVEFWRMSGEEGYTYHLWFRSNKMSLQG